MNEPMGDASARSLPPTSGARISAILLMISSIILAIGFFAAAIVPASREDRACAAAWNAAVLSGRSAPDADAECRRSWPAPEISYDLAIGLAIVMLVPFGGAAIWLGLQKPNIPYGLPGAFQMSTSASVVSPESTASMEVAPAEAEPSTEPGHELPSASYSHPSTLGPGFGWNIVVIVLGVLIALAGFFAGFSADTEDSAIRQTVAALWVLQGLVGLLIATIGILGATIIYAIETRRAAGSGAR